MSKHKHLYSFSYHDPENELCKIESKSIFNESEKNKILFSDQTIEPSNSAYIKSRLDIISFSEDYAALIKDIKKENITIDGFKVEYMVFDGDSTPYKDRLSKLKDIGFSIDGDPDYYTPTTIYALSKHEGMWYFGILIKDSFEWHNHKQKPHSYSNSISISVAKAIVNIATDGNTEKKLIDACCGVGTILIEACFMGVNIEGCEINEKVSRNAHKNLAHFNYAVNIYNSDINLIRKKYDAAIIDLPYNIFSTITDIDIANIIDSTARITDRFVIASTTDITPFISKAGFRIVDYCIVGKMGKRTFERKIWVCEHEL